jgi:hypothetical protein
VGRNEEATPIIFFSPSWLHRWGLACEGERDPGAATVAGEGSSGKKGLCWRVLSDAASNRKHFSGLVWPSHTHLLDLPEAPDDVGRLKHVLLATILQKRLSFELR